MTKEVRERPSELVQEVDEKGYFHRQKNHFTTPFGTEELPVEAGRYRLIWAKGCHWSNRASIVTDLLGLQEAVTVNLVGHGQHEKNLGWEFVYDKDHLDPILGVQFLSELYANADPDYTGRPTVPAVIDLQTKKVVNNDYVWLTNYFEREFRPLQAADAPDLYPEALRTEIDAYNDFLFENVNNGVYKAMFAQSLAAYEEAFDGFYAALDAIEERLAHQRFLFGDYVTDADVRLYVTLARFDTHYYRNLGPIRDRIQDFKNLWGYARDLYEIPAFSRNTYFNDIAKEEDQGKPLFRSYPARFWQEIDFDKLWREPQDRALLSKTPHEKFKRFAEKGAKK